MMDIHVAVPIVVAAVAAVGYAVLPQPKACEICRAVLWSALIGFFVNWARV